MLIGENIQMEMRNKSSEYKEYVKEDVHWIVERDGLMMKSLKAVGAAGSSIRGGARIIKSFVPGLAHENNWGEWIPMTLEDCRDVVKTQFGNSNVWVIIDDTGRGGKNWTVVILRWIDNHYNHFTQVIGVPGRKGGKKAGDLKKKVLRVLEEVGVEGWRIIGVSMDSGSSNLSLVRLLCVCFMSLNPHQLT